MYETDLFNKWFTTFITVKCDNKPMYFILNGRK
jgi:hypothetical protein